MNSSDVSGLCLFKRAYFFNCVLNAQTILLATAIFDILVLSEPNTNVAKYSQYTHNCNVEIIQNRHLEYFAMAFAHACRAIAEFLREHILEQASRTSPIVV